MRDFAWLALVLGMDVGVHVLHVFGMILHKFCLISGMACLVFLLGNGDASSKHASLDTGR